KNSQVTKTETVDISDCLVYAMKVTGKMNLQEYDVYCNERLSNKIPNWRTRDWRLKIGDCVYDYSKEGDPILRNSVHNEANRSADTGGVFALLSTKFYYFGLAAKQIPNDLKLLIKT